MYIQDECCDSCRKVARENCALKKEIEAVKLKNLQLRVHINLTNAHYQVDMHNMAGVHERFEEEAAKAAIAVEESNLAIEAARQPLTTVEAWAVVQARNLEKEGRPREKARRSRADEAHKQQPYQPYR